jgi:hypothetical protein
MNTTKNVSDLMNDVFSTLLYLQKLGRQFHLDDDQNAMADFVTEFPSRFL